MNKRDLSELTKIIKFSALVSAVLVLLAVMIGGIFAPTQSPKEEKDMDLDVDRREDDLEVRVYFHEQDELRTMDMETYLMGVVISEMPPEFHEEALKAQAVVARSYTYSRLQKLGGPGCDYHPEADVCTNPNHCQDYYTPKQVKQVYPERANEYQNKIEQAVLTTQSTLVTHEGDPLNEAPYHSTCGGETETAEDYWGGNLSYIESVECGYCEHSSRYEARHIITEEQLEQKLNSSEIDVPVASMQDDWGLSVHERSDSGRVLSASILGASFTGREIRSILGLPSTHFYWSQNTNGSITVDTKGFGHGVGFCQYGADGMGREGYDYEEIIQYFFQDVRLEDELY